MSGLANAPWPKFGHDNQNTGLASATGIYSDPSLQWSYSNLITPNSSAVIGSDGTIYVGSSVDHNLYAFSSTGFTGFTGGINTPLWTYDTGGKILTTPAIGADGTVYVGNDNGVFYAFYPTGTIGGTGTVLWSYSSGSSAFLTSPAIGADGTIYVGGDQVYAFSGTGYAGGTAIYIGGGGVPIIAGGTGTVLWSYANLSSFESSPAIGADGTIYIGCNDNNLYAFLSTGYSGGTNTPLWSFETANPITSAPTIGSDGTIYIGSSDGYLYAFSDTGYIGGTGDLIWTSTTIIAPNGKLAIGPDNNIYMTSNQQLYAFSPTGYTGGLNAPLWSYTTGDIINVPPVITSDGAIYIGSDDKYIYGLSTTPLYIGGNVEPFWSYLLTSKARGLAIGSDGVIYYTSDEDIGALQLIGPTGPTGAPPPTAICFLKGTQILTTHGEVLVENLTLQDQLITRGDIMHGKTYTEHSTSRVKNIIHFTEHNLGRYSRPICLQKDYASPNVPNRDLYVSPLHCILVGDELVQAHNLVNGTTIAYDMTCSFAEYYHIVLEKHSVIYSNNLATESCSFVELGEPQYLFNSLELTNTLQCM